MISHTISYATLCMISWNQNCDIIKLVVHPPKPSSQPSCKGRPSEAAAGLLVCQSFAGRTGRRGRLSEAAATHQASRSGSPSVCRHPAGPHGPAEQGSSSRSGYSYRIFLENPRIFQNQFFLQTLNPNKKTKTLIPNP